MKRFADVLAGLLVPAFLLAGAVVNSAMGQEKMAKDMAIRKVLLENAKVQVFEVTYKPGAENAIIPSSSYRVVRYLKDGTILRIYSDGNNTNWTLNTG